MNLFCFFWSLNLLDPQLTVHLSSYLSETLLMDITLRGTTITLQLGSTWLHFLGPFITSPASGPLMLFICGPVKHLCT